MPGKHFVAAKAAIFTFFFLVAEPTAQEGRFVLGWSEVENAIDRHPALAIDRVRIESAQAEIAAARQYPNPILEFQAGQARAINGGETAPILGLALTIPLQSPGIYVNEAAGKRAELEEVSFEAMGARFEIVRQIRELFIRIAADQALGGKLSDSRMQLEKMIEAARARVTAGEARPMDLTRLEIEFTRNRIDLESVEGKAAARRRILSAWLGASFPEEYEVDMNIFALPNLAPVEDLLERATAFHPAVLAAAAKARAFAFSVRVEKHKGAPEMTVGGFYDRELESHNFGGVLGITLPVWNWNRGGVARAEAKGRLADSEEALTRITLETAVREAWARANQAGSRALSYKEEIVPKIKKTAEDLVQMYKLGEVGVMDALDAQRSLADAETELLEALCEAQLAHLELNILTGSREHE